MPPASPSDYAEVCHAACGVMYGWQLAIYTYAVISTLLTTARVILWVVRRLRAR